MRALALAFSLSISGTSVLACTIETKSDAPAPATDGGATGSGGSGDGAAKAPAKSPLTPSKDAGAKPPANAPPETCRGALECLGECDGDGACEDGCFGGMSDAELAELQAISLCIADSGCTTDECVFEVCADVIDACVTE